MTASMPVSSFPRLLVVTEFSPNGSRGGGSGAVMRQMLKEWPTEGLFWWSCFPDHNRFFGQQVAAHRVARIPYKWYPLHRWVALKSWMMNTFWTPWAARHLRKTLEVLKPEAIWFHAHAWAIPAAARVLPGSGIGFHVSIHDYMGRPSCRCDRDFARNAEELYARAVTRDVISRQMLEDLRARYNVPGTINRAGLEQEDFDYLAQPSPGPGRTVRIAYAGTIIAAEEFALTVQALRQIRDQLSRPLTLEFYGTVSHAREEWFDPTWMTEHGLLNAAELKEALKGCDWGISPMHLSEDNPRYNRFSLPTKFVGYLQAGLPMIVIGHPESTVVKMATEYQIGLCVSDPQDLRAKLQAALSEPASKARYRSEIQRCARAGFDARRMRTVLYENFRLCAEQSSKQR